MADDQSVVLDWLATPASHAAERPVTVERIDTHSAIVFLAGTRAYKLKRSVRYSFLDFSTIEKRRQACEAEVRLNRRTAPRLYLGVEPVTRQPSGELTIGGTGLVLEWLIVMRRFPQDSLLASLADAGRLAPDLLTGLANAIADFHAIAVPSPHRGGAASMQDVIDDNARALSDALDVLPAAAVSAVNEASDEAVKRLSPLLDARRAGGFVRQCHGDLHLRNIVLLDGNPTLFDAIEFNDDFACIDVWYDTAFLLMDLASRGLSGEGNLVFNQYLLRTGDVGGLRLVPCFLSCRAAIRAKTSLAAAALTQDPRRREGLADRARHYLDLSGRLLAGERPRLIAIGGLSGSGKSTLAARLAPHLGSPPGAAILRSDVLRKVLLHRAPTEQLGPDGYTADVTDEVYRSALVRARDLLRQGWTAIVDATFLDARWRREVESLAMEERVEFTGLWLEAAPATLASRLSSRMPDASDADEAVLRQQLSRPFGEVTWARIDAGAGADETARVALDRLRLD